jgi:PAS domain S-box-containing protein
MENEFGRLVDALPGLVWTALPGGNIDFLNKRWCEYTGLDADAGYSQRWQTAIHPEDPPRLLEGWQSILASGEPGELEARLQRFDGEYRWFLFRICRLADTSGQFGKWCGIATDIDERKPAVDMHDRKRAEEELRRSEAFLAEGQRLNLTGSFSWRLDTDEITFSEQLYSIFEFDHETPVTFERIGSRVHPEDLPLLSENIEQARAGSSDFNYEIR